jgi:hypothetical protein
MADLKIVISALNKASGDLNKVKGDIEGVGKSGDAAKGGITGFGDSLNSVMGTAALVGGAVIAVGAALKEVYQTAKEGADLEYARTRFDNLAESIGTVSDALLDDLRTATSGMVSDAELVSGAADFMALGLAKTHEEVVRLSTVAGALGMNMNQLVLTLTNQTTMRFDALGVSVDGFKEKVESLKEAGMSAEEAFTEAFLQQAEEQIERVGSKTDTAAGSFARLESATANLKNALAEGLLPLITPLVEGLTDIIDLSDEGMATQAGNAALAVMQWSSVRAEWDIMRYVMSGMNDEADAMSLHIMALNEQFGSEVFFGGSRTQAIIDAYISGLVTTGEAADGAATAIQTVTDATNNADAAMRAYSESLLFKIASDGLSEEGALGLAYAMGLVDQNTVAATEQVSVYKQMLADGAITQRQYNLLVEDLATNIENLPEGKNLEVTTNAEDVSAELDDLENREFKQKSLTVELELDDSAVDDYSPPTKYGTVTYLPSKGTTNAVGGNVYAGNPYGWQEYGYRGELFVPSQDGYILSRAEAERALSRALVDGKSGGSEIDYQRLADVLSKVVNNTGSQKGGNTYNLNVQGGGSPSKDVAATFDLLRAYGGNF